MPRTAFAPSVLGSATPGLGKLAAAIGGGGSASFDNARDDELTLQSKVAQAIAATQAHQATSRLHSAQADQEEQQAAGMRPDAVLGNALLMNGVPTAQRDNVSDALQYGMGRYTPAGDGVGPVLPAPDWAPKLGAIAQAAGGVQRALTIGDKNVENIAKAGAIERGGRLSDAIIAGTMDRNKVGGAEAAVAGKPLFHQDSSGGVLDLFAGGLNTDNPLARSTVGLRTEQAGQAKAGAAENYAQGRAADALAAQRKQVTANGPGPGKVPVGYRYSTGQDGEARLEPIPGGPKDPNAQTGKPLPASAAKGYLENLQNMERAQKALDLVEGLNVGSANGDKEATGWKGYVPNTILNRMDPEGVDARAALADIGSMVIHDRSGAAVSASEFPRLQPFVPSVRDDAATVRRKLKLFAENYRAIVDDQTEFYKGSGYNVPALTKRNVAGAAPPAGGAARPAGAAPASSGWSIQPEK